MHRSILSQPCRVSFYAAARATATTTWATKAPAIVLAMLLLLAPAPTVRADDVGREIFLFTPAKLPEPMSQQFMLHIPQLIQKSGKLTLHVIEIPTHRVIASLSVPSRLTSDAMRRPEFRIGWDQARKFVQQASTAEGPEASTVSIDLPTAFGKIAAMRQTEAAPEVLMIGNPLYNNPREPRFAMEPHFVFSDSAWLLPRGPFGQEIAPIPPGSQFLIVSTDENWGFDATHQSGTERFYRVGVQHRLQGNLQPITSDLATAFRSLRSRNYQEFPKLDLEQVSPNAIGRDDRIWKMTVVTVTFVPE